MPSVEDIDRLPLRALPNLIAELAGLQARAAARLRQSDTAAESSTVGSDRLLDIREAAARLGMSADWLYRHRDKLPFARRVGRRAVRFSESDLERWIAAQRR
jgi:excisionase family DNA binding protein